MRLQRFESAPASSACDRKGDFSLLFRIFRQRGPLPRWDAIQPLGAPCHAYAALNSWFQGNQYTPVKGRRCRSHHIIPHRLHPVKVRITPFPIGRSSWRTDFLSKARLSGSCRQENVNESKQKLVRTRIGKYDFSAPRLDRSKGDQETFRRGALVRAETPKSERDRYRRWDSRKSYREHPYWSTNLKYVC
jgi:hypothetical protein